MPTPGSQKRDRSGKPVVELDFYRTADVGIIASFGGTATVVGSAQVYAQQSGTEVYVTGLAATPLSGFQGLIQLFDATSGRTIPLGVQVLSGGEPTAVYTFPSPILFYSGVFIQNVSGFVPAGMVSGLFAGAVQVFVQIDNKPMEE